MAFTASQGQALANRVRAWLTNSGQGAPSGELANFVDDLETARNVSTWAGVNYERILPFRVVGSASSRLQAVIRNSLIFMPIVITWISLSRAAKKFAEESASGSNINFLQLWHEMGPPFGLSWVAWADALIILGVVILTYRIGSAEEDDSRLRALQVEYEGLMVALERELSGYRYLSIQDINTAAAGTLQALLSSSQEIEKASASFAESAKQAHDAIDGAAKTVTTVFDPAVKRLDAVIASLASAAGTHQQMATLVQQIQTDFANEINTIRAGVAATINALDQRVNQVIGVIESRMGDATNSMRDGVTTVAQTVSDSMTRAVGAIDTTSRQAISQMNDAVVNTAATVSSQTTQELRAISQQLSQVAAVYGDLVANLGPVTNNVMVNTATLRDDLQVIHDRLRDITNRP